MVPLSTSFYLLLTGLGGGIAATLAMAPPRLTGAAFTRTMGLVAGGSLLAALAHDLWFRLGPAARPGLDTELGAAAFAAQALAAVILLGLVWRVQREPMPGRGAALTAALLSGAGVAVVAALLAGGSLTHAGLAAVQGLAGALVLGTAMSAMLLGHFYLIVPGLSIDPLKRLSRAFVAAILLRAVLDATAMLLGDGTSTAMAAADGADPIGQMLIGVIPLLMRVLFGLAGALLLAVMTVKTVELRATQSATGILYAAVVFVLIGEFAAGHMLVAAARAAG